MKEITIPMRLATVTNGKHKKRNVNVCVIEGNTCCCELPILNDDDQGELVLIHKDDLRFWKSINSITVSEKGKVTHVS